MKVILLVLFVFFGNSLQKSVKLKVTVYYEALCPDSIRFITKQLRPTYNKIGSFMNIDLVPYGKAKQTKKNQKWEFDCQHGPEECQANKQQACALHNSTDAGQSLGFISCVMDRFNPSDKTIVEKCAIGNGFSGEYILGCSESAKGDEYLAKYGRRTHAANPPISFVPMIVFNDVYASKIQYSSLNNLFKTTCKALSYTPPGCSSTNNYYKYVN